MRYRNRSLLFINSMDIFEMLNTAGLSETRRALLEKYIHGDLPGSAATMGTISRRDHDSIVPLSFEQPLWFLSELIPFALSRQAERAREASPAAPTSLMRYPLISIWEELPGTRPIGVRDNFFLLGGHSLLSARLVDRIEQVFGRKVSLPAIFAGPTIGHLATVLQGQEESTLRVVAGTHDTSKTRHLHDLAECVPG